ncbi:hypothetical protein QR680_016646 [Steinernema hermaphroditum]|uniref:Very-long-chain (3R)-3-hydroxyacyl-CoA dehydratase n=1 Tax=Steinernema hermaphroditum TaxID=289476 RepID=A0AA39HDT6_9BILA|nr:hypothetical protein QR680_016646 [Steinernema hermaphroditum]
MNNPFVYWAQDERNVFLRVDIRDAEDVREKAEPKIFALQAVGTAANGRGSYGFDLDLFGEILNDEKNVVIKSVGSNVNVTLKKRNEGFWPTLTAKNVRRGWLKIDFDRWIDPDADADALFEEEEQNERQRKIDDYKQQMMSSGNEDIDKLTRMFMEKEGKLEEFNGFASLEGVQQMIRTLKDGATAWLLAYNALMFFLHLFVVLRIGRGFVVNGLDYIDQFWDNEIESIRFATALQYLDVVHSICGLTKSGYAAGLVQVTGRLAMTYIIGGCDHLSNSWTTALLVVDWFTIECFRYPYYITAIAKKDIGWITWLRYSAWIPLYPTGLLLEAVSILRSIPFYYSSGRYGLAMPNPLNVSFNFGVALMLFVAGAFPLIAYYLLSHMMRQRAKKMVEMRKKKC